MPCGTSGWSPRHGRVQCVRAGPFCPVAAGYAGGMGEPESETGRFTFADHLAAWVGCVALLAGVALLALTDDTTGAVIGACLLGLCGVAWISLVFLLIGEGEERHRRRGGR